MLAYQDMEFKLIAGSGATAVVDTHYVTYYPNPCIVGVGETAVKELKLTLTPNPMRGKATFGIELPTAGHVALNVYDVNGRLVGKIADQVFPAGIQRMEWNPRDQSGSRVPSGLYFARLTTATGEKRARIVVVQ